MPIVQTEPTSYKGTGDAKRHRDKQREALKKKLPEIISEEAIITKKKSGIVKVPIKMIDIPHFRPRRDCRGAGGGQGPYQPGDILKRKPGQGNKPGEAGQEPGVDYIETEISIEELIEMMLEDIGLPRLTEKTQKSILVELGYRVAGRQKSGPWPLLDKKATVKEGIKRFWFCLRAVQTEADSDELAAFAALKETNGDVQAAIEFLRSGKTLKPFEKIEPFPIFAADDMRFHKIKENMEERSRAVVIAMMDVSASMTDVKKYYARSTIFWLVSFLRTIYKQVEIRFIVHHATARIVDEEEFFKVGESGGTLCHSAYELAESLIKSEYPTEGWNVYVWHFSDGEDFNADETCKAAAKLIDLGINMLGYGEINPEEEWGVMTAVLPNFKGLAESVLWKYLRSHFSLRESKDSNEVKLMTKDNLPFLAVFISARKHIFLALKEFLRKDRWKEVTR